MVNHEHNKISNNDVPIKIDGKAMFVVAEDIGLEDLEAVMQQLKDEGLWVEEVDMTAYKDLFKFLEAPVNAARRTLAGQMTELLQEICPGVEVVFTEYRSDEIYEPPTPARPAGAKPLPKKHEGT